jgi:hypothetical protein
MEMAGHGDGDKHEGKPEFSGPWKALFEDLEGMD